MACSPWTGTGTSFSSTNPPGEITGIPPEQAVGRKCWEVFKTQDCPGSCALRSCIDAGNKVANCVLYIERADGTKIPVSISAAPLKDLDGGVIGGVESFRPLNGPERPATPATVENFEDFCTCDRRMTRPGRGSCRASPRAIPRCCSSGSRARARNSSPAPSTASRRAAPGRSWP